MSANSPLRPFRFARAAGAALALAAASCSRPAPIPGPFTRAEIASVEKGEESAQLIYHYLKKDRDPRLKVPAWLAAQLPAMLTRPAWQDPDDGVLNEAQLWQASAAVLYEFFETTRKTFPPEFGGGLAAPSSLSRDYRDAAQRFAMTLDRLHRARLEGSLGGRGRDALDRLDRIAASVGGAAGAAAARDDAAYKASILAAAAGADDLLAVFQDRASR
jgi:hypothetical protein